MLAVKLHKRKKPYLGKGSFLIPIRTWRSGRTQVRTWLWLLNRFNKGSPNDCIRYITLVKIPDDHPVFLGLDWTARFGGPKFVKLKEVPAEIKQLLDVAGPDDKPPIVLQSYIRDQVSVGAPLAPFPELILGRRLPASCIKWTKDIRLFYRKDPTKRRSRKDEG